MQFLAAPRPLCARVARAESPSLTDSMRILVTGDAGHAGRHVAWHLESAGHEVIGFDRVRGQELADFDALVAAAADCEAVVHLAALAHDSAGTPADIMSVNVAGTWNSLAAA